ncbi:MULTISPECIES: energy-coupling factor transporter transmembrane component T family protein [Sutcliffiella]|uniref:Energy-coupling factor transporter transmembrane protein EcfT n=1 Tax=Sutcliffiella cohnii TaxID=33932 RepID=A0A223KX77_9BACI|nr:MULTISPECIES: energy-coupling factor transporter transmembrane component T [Sutcliffiella]AST94075.1 cobalt ABC transporter permease [Sutcliffiella cohnii]MED4018112.1 energy-coupling factor transporter transmembrane component T [Sutcliffiella cohnii]WBL15291.1 energy-coupling factor transporter transmembrane component T [Sutcliffiella sp. NC1]
MLNNLIIGRYVPKDSFVHRMDPRAKLILVFLFVFIVFLANNTWAYLILGLYVLFVTALTKIPITFILKGLKPIIWIILFTMVFHIFLTRGGELLFQIGPLSIYEEGIRQAIFISLRFLYLITITTILTLTTTPIEVTDGMETLFGPLKKWKVPVHELSLMMSISLRFIPTLLQETDKIMKAQSARGVDFSSGPIKDRVKALVPLLVPLFISSFKRAEELAIAMEARGYQGGEGRTKYRLLHWGGKDTVMLIGLVVLTIILIFIRT